MSTDWRYLQFCSLLLSLVFFSLFFSGSCNCGRILILNVFFKKKKKKNTCWRKWLTSSFPNHQAQLFLSKLLVCDRYAQGFILTSVLWFTKFHFTGLIRIPFNLNVYSKHTHYNSKYVNFLALVKQVLFPKLN